MRRLLVVLALAAFAGVGCSMNTTTPIQPQLTQHLYVTDEGSPGTIFVYDLPLTSSSVPAVILATTGHIAQNLCFDGAGSVYVAMTSDSDFQVFSLPLTSTSIPAFTLPASSPRDCHFDGSGNMYVATSANVGVYAAPVRSGSTLGTPVTNQVSMPFGVWTDGANDLFVCNASDVTEYSPLAAGNTLLAKFGTIVAGNNFNAVIGPNGSLYVPNGSARNEIDVYDPPFTNASTRNAAKTITVQTLTATNYLTWATFDRQGNLYVGASDNTTPDNHIYVFPFPYTLAAVNLDTGSRKVRGVAIGP